MLPALLIQTSFVTLHSGVSYLNTSYSLFLLFWYSLFLLFSSYLYLVEMRVVTLQYFELICQEILHSVIISATCVSCTFFSCQMVYKVAQGSLKECFFVATQIAQVALPMLFRWTMQLGKAGQQ